MVSVPEHGTINRVNCTCFLLILTWASRFLSLRTAICLDRGFDPTCLTTFARSMEGRINTCFTKRARLPLLLQYPLNFCWRVRMKAVLIIRLFEPKKDCCCLTSSQADIWSLIGVRQTGWNITNTFSSTLPEIILFLIWIIGKDFNLFRTDSLIKVLN